MLRLMHVCLTQFPQSVDTAMKSGETISSSVPVSALISRAVSSYFFKCEVGNFQPLIFSERIITTKFHEVSNTKIIHQNY